MKNLRSKEYITGFQQNILKFYINHGRHSLSFRQTTNAYHIHLSEIMLSQTQVLRVEQYFTKWLTTFPTIESVATAPKTKLLRHWQGLGYNSRVLNFQIACQHLLKEYDGTYPTNEQYLLRLKGVGPYVASAILAFAFNINAGVVDTNIRRILIYYNFADEDTSTKELKILAKELTPKNMAREWNNALMDFGALHLTAKKTNIPSKGKQGKFEGSTRQVRSFIVKNCLQNGSCDIKEVQALCNKYEHNAIKIITKLINEEVIHQQKSKLFLND